MTLPAIQKNLDGSYPGLSLQDIFAFEPAAKALFSKAVCIGLQYPLADNTEKFMRQIKPEVTRLTGWEAKNPALSSADTYEAFYKACLEAANCWDFYRPIRDKRWGYSAFKKKFGMPPRFNGRDIGGVI